MIEQSNLDGPVFGNTIVHDPKDKLISKPLKPQEIQFGISYQIQIVRNPQTRKVLVKYIEEAQPHTYLYTHGDHGELLQQFNAQSNPQDEIETYFYGMAKRAGQLEPYFMKNPVPVTLKDLDIGREQFTLPPSLLGYPYSQTFQYIPQLVNLVGDLPATYTDRFKRPLNPNAMRYQKYYPTSMHKLPTKFKDLNSTPQHFPIVVELNPDEQTAQLACLDLEPKATEAQKEVLKQYEAYYVEDTPRGGKHYLVKINPDNQEFKYRLNPNLEVQVHCQITLYGINGTWLNDDPKVAHFDANQAMGHQKIMTTEVKEPAELTTVIDNLVHTNQMLGQYNPEKIKRDYMLDDDVSHADWNALYHLYLQDIAPFANQIDNQNLPWVLSFYAERMIPTRAKHFDNREGLPYLVWIAAKVITWVKEQRGEIYE